MLNVRRTVVHMLRRLRVVGASCPEEPRECEQLHSQMAPVSETMGFVVQTDGCQQDTIPRQS